jgi:flagellar hook-basal body complex protein FliE
MIGGVQNVSALSFTRAMEGAQETGSTSSIMQTPLAGQTQGVMPAGEDFGATLASMATDMVGSLRGAEQSSFDGINGQADMREVVDAMMTAEQTLQTAIAIRDKIVTAYLEVSRMQI